MRIFENAGQQNTGTVAGFAFSGVRPETLGATEYTLVSIFIDVTGSVTSFSGELLKAAKSAIESCKKSPRADYLLVRYAEFNTHVDEVHARLVRACFPGG